jgi:DNA (cytosine-5)-methyltransferase 1
LDYAFGAVPIPAAGVGAPHLRDRMWWVAGSGRERRVGRRLLLRTEETGRDPAEVFEATRSVEVGPSVGDLGDASSGGRGVRRDALEPGGGRHADGPGLVGGFWSDAEWVPCRDGKSRPVEPGTFPLAHGAPARVGRLRAYGNAIVAPVAVEFIKAVMAVRP